MTDRVYLCTISIKKSLALGLVKEVAIEGLRLRRGFCCIYRKEKTGARLLGDFIAFVGARVATTP